MTETTQTFELTDKQKEIRAIFSTAARYCLVYGGSRSGKTFFIVYAIITRAIKSPGSRHAIFRRHGVAVKQSIGKDTFKKVMELAYPDVEYKWHEQDSYFSFPHNKAEVWLAGLDDKDRVDKVLGKEYVTLYFNEASEIPLASYNVALTRLAQVCKQVDGRPLQQKVYVDLNPTTTSHWTYRMWVDGINPEGETKVDQDNYSYIVVNPMDNMANLDADYLKSLRELPERQRQRFFYGEFTGDLEHALWRRRDIKRSQNVPGEMKRIVVAIDPAISNDVGSDETGIIVAGIDKDNKCYVLEDASGKYRPEEWARRAVTLFDLYEADRIVAETNQGGAMVKHTIETQRKGVPFTDVKATRGKFIRAEPVAALYEQGKVFHAHEFTELENQMCSFTIDFDRKLQGYSPDRVDALVWALTELFPRIIRKPMHNKQTSQPKARFF